MTLFNFMISQLLFLLLLILLNAFFAAAEIAFISLNDAKISQKANSGDKKSISIKAMLDDPSKFLATIQIGITLAGFLSSAFASEAFASKLAPVLNSYINLGLEVWTGASIIIVTIILSYFSLVFGELVPKRLAMKYSEKLAYFSIDFIKTLSLISSPFVKLLTVSTNIVSRLFGVAENEEETVTENDIKVMVNAGEEDGNIKEDEKALINNVFEFNDKVVSDIMTHRTNIFAIDINADIDYVLYEIDRYKYSRVPVYENTIDNIKGIIYIKDLIKYLRSDETIELNQLLREPFLVSENKVISDLFKELQRNNHHAAIVIDEYGGTAGFVTMEDILEELVGNIFDEFDDIQYEYEKLDEKNYIVSGSINIDNFEKNIGLQIPDGEYDTLSGYLIEKLGRIPQDTDKPMVDTPDAVYQIKKCSNKRIVAVKVIKK